MTENNDSILRVEENGIEYFTVRATGESAVSQRGLSRATGIPESSLRRWFSDLRHEGVPEDLKALLYKTLDLRHETTLEDLKAVMDKRFYLSHPAGIKKNGKEIKPILADIAADVVAYAALDLHKPAAIATLKATNKIGFTSFIHAKTGYLPEEYTAAPGAHEELNRIMNQPRPFHPLFGDKNMDAIAKLLKVGRNHPKLATWMWSFIYVTLTPQERAKLDEVNPVQPNGHRKQMIHQWLEENATEAHKEHFDQVLIVVNISRSEQEFYEFFSRINKGNFQGRLFDF